jgi:hypothetical protein
LVKVEAIHRLYNAVKKMDESDKKMIEKFLKSQTNQVGILTLPKQNKFNSATPEELAHFFKDLKGIPRGQKLPVLSQKKFSKFIISICENKVEKGMLKPNLVKSDEHVLRRLFYDFYDEYNSKDTSILSFALTKQDYFKFIELFTPFQNALGNPSFLKNSSSKTQTTTLRDLVSRKKNPRAPR